MEDIVIPMSRGNMEDIEQDHMTESMTEEMSESQMAGDASTSTNTQSIYEREDRLEIF